MIVLYIYIEPIKINHMSPHEERKKEIEELALSIEKRHQDRLKNDPEYKKFWNDQKKERRNENIKEILYMWTLPIQGIGFLIVYLFPYLIAIFLLWLLLR